MAGSVSLGDFMGPKGWKAVGNKLVDQVVSSIKVVDKPASDTLTTAPPDTTEKQVTLEIVQGSLFDEPATEKPAPPKKDNAGKKFKAGDVIDFD